MYDIYIQKLADRLAFERGETRLVSLAINRLERAKSAVPSRAISVLQINQSHDETHAELVRKILLSLKPEALDSWRLFDGVNRAYRGFFDVLVSPHSDFLRIFQILYFAKLASNGEWEVLIDLTRKFNGAEASRPFKEALAQERQHLTEIKQIYYQLVVGSDDHNLTSQAV